MKKKRILCFFLLLLLILICSVCVYYYCQVIFRGGELKGLSTSFLCYANENNDYLPDAARWSDILIEEDWLAADYFEEGQTRYAMNIHASGMKMSDLPKDMVLLFEAKGPKNLCGGPELIKAQKYRWPGHAVQFGYAVDYIRFYNKSEIDDLRWKP